ETAVLSSPVAWFRSRSCASATTAPCSSVTTPRRRAEDWADAREGRTREATAATAAAKRDLRLLKYMDHSLMDGCADTLSHATPARRRSLGKASCPKRDQTPRTISYQAIGMPTLDPSSIEIKLLKSVDLLVICQKAETRQNSSV